MTGGLIEPGRGLRHLLGLEHPRAISFGREAGGKRLRAHRAVSRLPRRGLCAIHARSRIVSGACIGGR